ncbi:hypothetical protein Mlute_00525 [Meiothermus luteus]|jgi:hypothetical protein|uniref:Uncharacterized protein n=1 Tax=Meiothermus luteus TaxID=2026184 RepID=A0A399EVS1_9DEIN|nr:hypothetical protein Mlute_00525 [Meiothermus luteus]
MEAHRQHPIYYLDAETLLVATYVWVDDALKALKAQGLKLPKGQKHQKATSRLRSPYAPTSPPYPTLPKPWPGGIGGFAGCRG